MAENETKETSVSKVIANVLKAAREQQKQSKPQEVAATMRRMYPEKTATPGTKQLRVGRIIENAKQVVAEAKIQGVHVSTGLHEWLSHNKLPVLDENPAQAFKIAKADLAVAIKASDLPEDHWVVQAASRVKNAESAEALAIIALAPKEVRDNPNFIFQTAAQLAGSNVDPETQVTTKAFVAELKNLRGVDGFEMNDRQLFTALTEQGLGAMPAPPPDTFPDFSTLPDSVKNLFEALKEQYLAAGTDFEKYRILTSYDSRIGSLDTSTFTKDQNILFTKVLRAKQDMEQRVVPPNVLTRAEAESISGVRQTKSENIVTRLSIDDAKLIITPAEGEGPSGADRWYERLSDRIFTSGREARQPDLTDQYEYSEFENILRQVFGDETAMALLAKYRARWNDDYLRNAVFTRIMSGYGGEKELIQLASSTPSDTLNYETRIRFAPEAIAAEEMALTEIATEHRYQYDEDSEYVTGDFLDPHKKPIFNKFKRKLNRAEVWQEHPDKRAAYFPGGEYQKMVKAMAVGHGSMVEDAWLVPNTPEYMQLLSLTKAMEAEIAKGVGGATEATVEAKYHDRLETLWRRVTLRDAPPEGKLFNPEYVEKIRGFSPLEMRTLEKLEAQLKLQTPGRQPDTWELRKGVLAARRFMIGSKRMLSLVGNLSNMPGLRITPSAADVMVESMEYGMRSEQAERFIFNRFGIGKETAGKRIMAEEQINLCGLRGVTLGDTDLKQSLSDSESMPMRRYRTVLEKTKNAYGTGFGQLAVGTLLDSNCPFDYSTWRPEAAIIRVLDEKYGPAAQHLALGLRLKMTEPGPGEKLPGEKMGKNWKIRARFIDDISKRELSIPILLLGTENFDTKILKDIAPGTPEWNKFLKVLGLAEHRIFNEAAFFTKNDFDIVEQTYFNQVFTDEVFNAAGITGAAEIQRLKNQYHTILADTQNFFYPEKNRHGTPGEMWAKEGFPITLSMRDFNLGEADFKKIGESAQFRGDVGDTTSRLEARNDMMEIISNPEISMPEDVKKTLIPAIGKLGKDINAYKDSHFSEVRASVMLDSVLSHLRAKDTYRGIVQFVPFVPALMRGLVGLDMSKPWIRAVTAPARWLVKGYTTLTGQKELQELLDHNIKEWPQIFGQEFISGAVGVKGGKFTTPMAIDMNKIIEDIEHAGIFTEHGLLHSLRDKYKTRVGYRIGEGFLRFWWVPFAAAIAVGVIIAMKEQGLDEHK